MEVVMALPAQKTTYIPAESDQTSLARLLNAALGDLKQFLDRLRSNTSLDNIRLSGVVLASLTTTTINHKLGRIPQEWWITRITGPSTIYEAGRTATTITLYSSGAVTVDLRVA
jgi:hypothetical protein